MKKFLACDPLVYKHNLSLFIACLTKQVLVEPFHEAPADMSNVFPTFTKEYNTTDIKREVTKRLFHDSFKPPYKMDISQDLHEYVAFQEVPLFGAHFYYAFSPATTINHWQNFSTLKIPRDLLKAFEQLEDFLAQVPESPIKGRISRKPKSNEKKKSGGAKSSLVPKVKAKPSKEKPKWEGDAEEPEPEPEPTKKPMVVFPTDGPVKSIPAALQRRMALAEQQSKIEAFYELFLKKQNFQLHSRARSLSARYRR